MDINKTFSIDETSTDEERIYIDVAGRGSVCIIQTHEGIIVDLYSAAVSDNSVATMGATWDEIG